MGLYSRIRHWVAPTTPAPVVRSYVNSITPDTLQVGTSGVSSSTNLRKQFGRVHGNMILATGFSSDGDIAPGLFQWNETSDTDDGGTVIVPSDTDGASVVGGAGSHWKRITNSTTVNLAWFGAVPNIDTDAQATANSTALTNAIAWTQKLVGGQKRGGTIVVGHGTFYLKTPIQLSTPYGVSIIGEKPNVLTANPSNIGTVFVPSVYMAASDYLIQTNNAQNCNFANFGVAGYDRNSVVKVAVGFDFYASSHTSENSFHYVFISGCPIGLYVHGNSVAANMFDFCIVSSCTRGIVQANSQTAGNIYTRCEVKWCTEVGMDFVGGDVTVVYGQFVGHSTTPTYVADIRVYPEALWCRFRDNYHEVYYGKAYDFPDVPPTDRVCVTLFDGVRVYAIAAGAGGHCDKMIDYHQNARVVLIGCHFDGAQGSPVNSWNTGHGGTIASVLELGCEYINGATSEASGNTMYEATLCYTAYGDYRQNFTHMRNTFHRMYDTTVGIPATIANSGCIYVSGGALYYVGGGGKVTKLADSA